MCNGGGNSVKKFADGGSTGTKSKSAPKPKPTVAAAPNRAEAYRKSAGDRELDRLLQENLSKPLPASAYVDMPMSEYGARVANNAVPSVVRMATELGTMAMNPIDTASSLAKGIGQLGYGAGSKIARNVLGYEGDRASEAPLDAFIADTKGHYGLGQPGEFWKNLAEDPASYIGDAATLATGGAGAALKATKLAKVAAGVVDDAQTAQYLRFLDDTTPKTDVTDMAGFQYYRPSPLESAEMGNVSKNNPWAYVSGVSNSGPNKTQQIYLDSVREAEFLRTQGAPEKFIQEQTGILTIPIKNPRGSSLGDLDVAAVTPEEMVRLRPSRANNYGANIFDASNLKVNWYDPTTWGNKNIGGYHYKDPQTSIHQIGLNPKLTKEQQTSVVDHEMTHADLEEAGLGTNIVGANTEDLLKSKNKWLNALKQEGIKAKDPALKAEIKAARDKLAGMTALELYYLTPGEMLARLAEGDPTMARRLSALEILNPYINDNQGLIRRGINSLRTAAFTETRPYMSGLKEILKPYGVNPAYDLHRRVPTDIDKAIVAGLDSTRIP